MAKTLRKGLSMIETNPLNHNWSDIAILSGLSLHHFQIKLLLRKLMYLHSCGQTSTFAISCLKVIIKFSPQQLYTIFSLLNFFFSSPYKEYKGNNSILLLQLSRFAVRKVFQRVSNLFSQFLRAELLCWEKFVQVRGRRLRICDIFEG